MKVVHDSKSIIGKKEFPAVSILLPMHTEFNMQGSDRERLLHLVKRAEQKLKNRYSGIKADQMMEKLHHAVNSINFTEHPEGLAIFVSPESQRVIRLPYSVREKVIVDESFEIRDLLLAAKLRRNYLLVILSQNGVKTLFSEAGNFFPVEMDDMPENVSDVVTEHSFSGWDYQDTKAWEEKNIRNYIRFIDDTIKKEISDSRYPVIIMGDVKLIGMHKSVTAIADRIAGYVEGNFEHAGKVELQERVRPVLNEMSMKEKKEGLRLLRDSVSADLYAAGIAQVWRAAAEGRGRLLLVEKDYRQSARFGQDTYTIILDEEVEQVRFRIEDAVDDILEMVLNYNGDILFMEPDELKEYQKIALITRY